MKKKTLKELNKRFDLVPTAYLKNYDLTDSQMKFLGILHSKILKNKGNAENIHNTVLSHWFPSEKYRADIVQPLIDHGLVKDSPYVSSKAAFYGKEPHPRAYSLTRDYYTAQKKISLTRLHQKASTVMKGGIPKIKFKIDPVSPYPIDAVRNNGDKFSDIVEQISVADSIAEIPLTKFNPLAYPQYQENLKRFIEGKLGASSTETGRFYHSIVLLPSIFREHLTFQGQKLAEIDVKACQVTILYSLYKRYGFDEAEARRFKELIESGKDVYTEIWGNAWKDREKIKDNVSAFLNGEASIDFKNEMGEDMNRTLAVGIELEKAFPELGRFMQDQFCTGEQADFLMGSIIQRTEADIMIGEVFIKNVPNIVMIPIHDAILCLPEDAGKVKDLIEQAFLKVIGIKPRLEIDVP